jgi:hypothetical protein
VPITLKNRHALPTNDYDTVKVLGLDIPLTKDLPFGAQVEVLDLQGRYESGDFGQVEYLMRLFCVFTRRLAKAEHVRYDWLAQQSLEADEVAELMSGTLALLNALKGDEPDVVGEGKAPEAVS